MTGCSFVGVLILAVLGHPQASARVQVRPTPPIGRYEVWAADTKDILTRVYESSQARPPYERVFLLAELADVSLGVSPKLAAKHARELFETSFDLSEKWYSYRHAAQMNGVRLLAESGDGHGAADLFARMEPPGAVQGASKDLRESALVAVMRALLETTRPKALNWARAAISRVSASGHYPYRAAQALIEELLRDDQQAAEAVYAEAVGRLRKRGPPSLLPAQITS